MPYKRKDSPYWWVSYTSPAGKRIKVSSGLTDFRKAKAEEQRLRSEAHRVRSPSSAKTFDDVMEVYLAAKQLERAAYSALAMMPYFGGMLVEDISAATIAAYKAGRKVSDSTQNKELGTFRAAIRYCNRELEWNVPDPTDGKIPRERRGRLRWITRREACRLVVAANHSTQAPYLADLIVVALHTGLRRGELLGLEWSRVDMVRKVLYLSPEHQKGRKHSTVPLNAHAREALRHREGYRNSVCPESRWVFTKTGERVMDVKKSFATACRKAQLTDFHFHDLRHTCAAWLVQAKVPLRTVAEVLRHASIQTTMRYAHLAPEDAMAGVTALERTISRTTGGQ